jgi:hypothetical protein
MEEPSVHVGHGIHGEAFMNKGDLKLVERRVGRSFQRGRLLLDDHVFDDRPFQLTADSRKAEAHHPW